MSVDPLVVTPDDLALYMGLDSINNDRAQLLIDQIILLCEAVVSPLPAAASPVVLDAAANAYATPPGSITSELVGPYQATRRPGGLFLTKGQRATLRLLSGGGSAFSINLLATGYPDSQFPPVTDY